MEKKICINKILAIVLVLAMSVMVFAGCANTANTSSENKKYSIVCTTFPQYDWVREIIGSHSEDFELTLLLDNGVDLHSYQPTAEDISKIASADMFIYVGGESDGWVKDALKEATNKNVKVINMLESLGSQVKEEEVVEGMEVEEGEEEAPEYDEHVWLSIKNAAALTEMLAKVIEEIDTTNASDYTDNGANYITKLNALDKQYEETVNSASKKTVVFGDRFPFRYLVDDYGINYYAAFVGCSAETNASFETITFLAGKVDALGLSSILVIENSDQKIAETIKQNTSNKAQQILVMDSLQSITDDELSGGTTYYSVMLQNLEVLKQALK
ncbi:metal ABC transporter substrate-binding protein [Cellulosilyticum ruminicola]|uniref:metal ABC transporter substrate-binding protein n=1 Tax=Cellulosilyticum ruminicola TaxID=425254 RepID=UPI000B19C7C8|nr:metal ABC transporter substrate-binding protein [Cellulosilyticum ruminicola]